MNIRRVASLKTADDFRETLSRLGILEDLPFDEIVESGPDAPLARSFCWRNFPIGNRFAILPMEGWDGTADGKPSDLTTRRWQHFGISGAKLIWGGEAAAVRTDGRANPNQLIINDTNLSSIESLRECLVESHQERFGHVDDLLIGLQLTHSGRFSRPANPTIAYRHALLDHKFALSNTIEPISDDGIALLVEDFALAARLAQKAGFAFVDVKQCHGYFGHELLSAVDRPGRYGGSFENRTRFVREVIEAIRSEAPGLEIGSRISIFDFLPFQKDADGRGEPMVWPTGEYPYAFGGDPVTGLKPDLAEPSRFLSMLQSLDVDLICTTAGTPYYNPHLLRPAAFPPSDGYLAPEDPLLGVARQIQATAELKRLHPSLVLVGSAYSYLQEWLPHVAQRTIRDGRADFVGIGRMVLSYPEFPADVLAGRPRERKKLCRTFSDCTTAPRKGLVSGCYPLDPFYKERPERELLKSVQDSQVDEIVVP
jgi:NADPH2 dehydrogenase